MDAATLRSIGRLDNPYVFLAVVLLQFLVVLVEFAKFIGQNVSVGNEVKVLLSVTFLHAHDVEAEAILAGNLVALREMVDLLVLVEAFIQVALAGGRRPQDVPLVRLGRRKTARLKHGSNQFVVKSQHLIEKLAVFDVVTLLVAIELHVVRDELLFSDVLENEEVRLVLAIVVVVARRIRATARIAVEESLVTVRSRHGRVNGPVGDSRRAIDGGLAAAVRHDALALVLELLQLHHALSELTLSLFLLYAALADSEHPFAVHKVAGAGTARILTVDTLPVRLEVLLDVLQAV